MSSDVLADIDGIKPDVELSVGEEHQVKSGTSKSVYNVKRHEDHYFCSCPAWRNQKGVATDARTCKHLKSLLGEKYEAARIKRKNSGSGSQAASETAAPKIKAGTKRKKADEDEEDDEPAKKTTRARKPASKVAKKDADEDEEEPAKRTTRTRKPASKVAKKEEDAEEDSKPKRGRKAAPASKGKAKEEDEDEDGPKPAKRARKAAPASKSKEKDDDAMDEDDAPVVPKQVADGPDELSEIDGIKPLVVLKDGETADVKSGTSKSVYKVKRTWDHYYCSCPAWRNQSGVPTDARTCKHLKSFLGEEYEEARLNRKSSTGEKPKSTSDSKKPASKKPPSKKPASTSKKPASTTKKPASKKAKVEEPIEEEVLAEDDDAMDDDEGDKENAAVPQDLSAAADGDELAEIDGHKPKVYMKDGEEKEAMSLTSSSTYKIKRTWDHYYCTCPAWRNQGGAPTNARTCKHLKALLGDEYEEARVKWKNPDGPAPTKKRAPTSKGGAKGGGTKGPGLLLANKWDLVDGPDPTGWWISEKLDGVRSFFDGTQTLSRLGNPFSPPQWFLDKFPKEMTLDGEFFGGRRNFQDTVSIVKTANSPHWKNITFQVFDIPSRGDEPFEERIEFLKATFGPGGTHTCKEIFVVEHTQAESKDHVLDMLKEVESLGGEGLMLREPGSKYVGHRSGTLLKAKTFYDAEAEVTGYVPGKGRTAGMTGSLKCKMASGKTFNVGSGLSDKQRKNPPKIGSIISYRFQELTRDLVPRFPTFLGEAIDKDEPKDAELPEHRKVTATTKQGDEDVAEEDEEDAEE